MDYNQEAGLLVSLCIAIRIGSVHKAVPRLLAQAKHPEVKDILRSLSSLPYATRESACRAALYALEQQLLG